MREQGVNRNIPVAIYLPRNMEWIVLFIAIIKAGGVYLPIDITQPATLVNNILAETKANFCVSSTTQARALSQEKNSLSFILVDVLEKQVEGYSFEPPLNKNIPDDFCYIIYTSGSTGKPKGVVNLHKGIVNLAFWMREYFQLSENDRVLQKCHLSFDASIFEVLAALTSGASLVIINQKDLHNIFKLSSVMVKYSITFIHFVPSQFSLFLKESLFKNSTHLKHVVCAGEQLLSKYYHQFIQQSNATLYNLYGPTETSICASAYQCKNFDQTSCISIPIGKPISSIQFYVVDKHRKILPIGKVGELCIAGSGLAKGYYNNLSLTADKFIEITSYDQRNIQVYCTGDLVQWISDGNLRYIRRVDDQIKIRGFRIEPAEIEAAFLRMPLIDNAVVVAKKTPSDQMVLIRYLVLKKDAEKPTEKLVRCFLEKEIPSYMIPNQWVWIDSIPISQSGKLNRGALPEPKWINDLDTLTSLTDLEACFIKIWQEVLQVSPIKIEDNFYFLGGDSILSAQISALLRRENIFLPPHFILQYPTIKQLVILAKQKLSYTKKPIQSNIQFNLSPIQHWFFNNDFKDYNFFCMSYFVTVSSLVNINKLKEAIEAVISQHDAFRISITRSNKQWKQAYQVHKKTFVEFVEIPEKVEKKQWMLNKAIECQQQLSIENNKVIKILLFQDLEKNLSLFFSIHHAVIDGVSWRILLDDLEHAYHTLELNGKCALPAKSNSFREWLCEINNYSKTFLFKKSQIYWRNNKNITPLFPDDTPVSWGEMNKLTTRIQNKKIV